MKQERLHEQGILIGIGELRDDIELMNSRLSLLKLRHLVDDILMLEPLIKPIEKHLVQALALKLDFLKTAVANPTLSSRDRERLKS